MMKKNADLQFTVMNYSASESFENVLIIPDRNLQKPLTDSVKSYSMHWKHSAVTKKFKLQFSDIVL